MQQRTITYTRSVTVTHSDDYKGTDEQLLHAIDHEDITDNTYGIFVVEDEISNMGSCTTSIGDPA